MKIITILGTRPEIIKLSSLLPLLDQEFEHVLVHTGQHYDYNMDKVFFEELNLPQPKYFLSIGSHPQGKQTGLMLEKIEEVLVEEKPNLVIVEGDTNTTMAGALAAAKLHISIMHVEAGCRSFNRKMPEEINRIIVDHIADYLIAPDEKSFQNLLNEGISKTKIFLLGSTAFDAALRNKNFANIKGQVLENDILKKDDYVLVTLHRAENTDNPVVFAEIMGALKDIAKEVPIIFPIHPRTKKKVEENNSLKMNNKIQFIPPKSYLSFLSLLSNCRFCISDSGGIQEEAVAFNVPCLIPRNETEWMRLVEAGKNKLIGTKKESMVSAVLELWKDNVKLENMKTKESPFSSGVSQKIIKVIKNLEEMK